MLQDVLRCLETCLARKCLKMCQIAKLMLQIAFKNACEIMLKVALQLFPMLHLRLVFIVPVTLPLNLPLNLLFMLPSTSISILPLNLLSLLPEVLPLGSPRICAAPNMPSEL